MEHTLAMNAIYGLSSSHNDNLTHLGGALGGTDMAFTFGPQINLCDDCE
jgi:hypothetical protein